MGVPTFRVLFSTDDGDVQYISRLNLRGRLGTQLFHYGDTLNIRHFDISSTILFCAVLNRALAHHFGSHSNDLRIVLYCGPELLLHITEEEISRVGC